MKTIGLTASLLFASFLTMSSCGNGPKQSQAGKVSESVQGVKTMTMEDGLQVTWIQDNASERLMPRFLFAAAPDSLFESLSLQGGIPSTVSTFLLQSKEGPILFDAGLGQADSRLIAGLASIGIAPEDVKYIYLTHFHGDHIGGLMKEDTAVFPHAEIYASQLEYDAWMAMPDEKKSQVVRTMDAYKDRLHLFGFGDTLPGGVAAIEAIGHTPGHTVYQAGKLLVVGDLMHGTALQLPHPEFCASYDMEPGQAVKTRREVLDYARKNALTMAGMHFPAPAFLILEENK